VVRHPDEVMASHYLFVRGFDENSCKNRSEWLLATSRFWQQHVEKWTALENTLVFRFEDIVLHPELVLEKIALKLNLTLHLRSPVLPPRLKSLWHGRFRRLFCVDSPSTEILTKGQGQTFEQIFHKIDLSGYRRNVEEICKRFGYEVL
jgi:hypothetical protein